MGSSKCITINLTSMKHFINIFITLLIVGMAIGVSYLQSTNEGPWFFLFFPLIIMMFFWGKKLTDDY